MLYRLKGLFHMLNNKGQSLVLFVIILPILFLILILVIDIGRLITLKNELNNINNIVLDYGLDNLEMVDLENKLIDVINLNKDDIDNIDVTVDGDKIYINMNEKLDAIFDIKISYIGYMDNGKKRIERMGD